MNIYNMKKYVWIIAPNTYLQSHYLAQNQPA